MQGRTLTLFIMKGNPRGLRQVELDNWTGVAVMGARQELEEARQLPELKTAALYLLLDKLSAEEDVQSVYVGETDDFSERGVERNTRLPTWEHFIVFFSKDKNLTKAHVRWLELSVYQRLQSATGRVIVANGNTPPGATLPKSAEAMMQTYSDNMVYTLAALGLDFFSALQRQPLVLGKASQSDPIPSVATHSPPPDSRYWLYAATASKDKAYAILTDGIWVLQTGSKVAGKIMDSLSVSYRALRQSLLDRDIFVSDGSNLLTVTSEVEFNSPTAAAAIVRGYSINGKYEWRRDSDDKRYSDVLNES